MTTLVQRILLLQQSDSLNLPRKDAGRKVAPVNPLRRWPGPDLGAGTAGTCPGPPHFRGPHKIWTYWYHQEGPLVIITLTTIMNSLNHLIVLFKVYISFTHHHFKLITHAITQLCMRYARVMHAITQLLMRYARTYAITHMLRTRYTRVTHVLRTRYARVTHALRTQLRTRYARVMQAVPRAPTKLNRALLSLFVCSSHWLFLNKQINKKIINVNPHRKVKVRNFTDLSAGTSLIG